MGENNKNDIEIRKEEVLNNIMSYCNASNSKIEKIKNDLRKLDLEILEETYEDFTFLRNYNPEKATKRDTLLYEILNEITKDSFYSFFVCFRLTKEFRNSSENKLEKVKEFLINGKEE